MEELIVMPWHVPLHPAVSRLQNVRRQKLDLKRLMLQGADLISIQDAALSLVTSSVPEAQAPEL